MTNAQDATPRGATPVIYEGLEFPELPYGSRWVEVDGVRIHYTEGGNPGADPILFLHGIPTWSYIWRDVMPVVEPIGRVIAVDFVGFGRSERPAIAYDLATQVTYLEGFVAALALHDLTLVIQDLGSAVGFAYASAHEDKVKRIVFMEATVPPIFSLDFVPTGALAEFMATIQTILQPGVGEEMILNQNAFIEQILPAQIRRSLTEAEMNAYRAPFPTPESRRPILDNGPRQFANPAAFELIGRYSEWLTTTTIPMLHLYVTPGLLNLEAAVQWSRTHIRHIEQQHMGAGGHFFQEDHPAEIGAAIVDWLGRVVIAN
jgi:haloalkane dehalogenase